MGGWDGVGYGWSPGGTRYRAPYCANKANITIAKSEDDDNDNKDEDNDEQRDQTWF